MLVASEHQENSFEEGGVNCDEAKDNLGRHELSWRVRCDWAFSFEEQTSTYRYKGSDNEVKRT